MQVKLDGYEAELQHADGTSGVYDGTSGVYDSTSGV